MKTEFVVCVLLLLKYTLFQREQSHPQWFAVQVSFELKDYSRNGALQ